MLIACLVIILALFANQTVFLILFIDAKRKAATARQAALQYIDKSAEQWARFLLEHLLTEKSKVDEELEGIQKKVAGLSLDYGQAQAAANQINNYAQGIADIFNYDPMEAIQAARERGKECG